MSTVNGAWIPFVRSRFHNYQTRPKPMGWQLHFVEETKEHISNTIILLYSCLDICLTYTLYYLPKIYWNISTMQFQKCAVNRIKEVEVKCRYRTARKIVVHGNCSNKWLYFLNRVRECFNRIDRYLWLVCCHQNFPLECILLLWWKWRRVDKMFQ